MGRSARATSDSPAVHFNFDMMFMLLVISLVTFSFLRMVFNFYLADVLALVLLSDKAA